MKQPTMATMTGFERYGKKRQRALQRAQQRLPDSQCVPIEERIDVDATFDRERERRRDLALPLSDFERSSIEREMRRSGSALAPDWAKAEVQSEFQARSARLLEVLRTQSGATRKSSKDEQWRTGYDQLVALGANQSFLQMAALWGDARVKVGKQPVPRAIKDDVKTAKKAARIAEQLAATIDYLNQRSVLRISDFDLVVDPQRIRSRLPVMLRDGAQLLEVISGLTYEPDASDADPGDYLLVLLDSYLRAVTGDARHKEVADLLTAAAIAEGKNLEFDADQIRMRIKRFRHCHPENAVVVDRMVEKVRLRFPDNLTNHTSQKK